MNITALEELLGGQPAPEAGADSGPWAFAPDPNSLLHLRGPDGRDLLQRLAASDLAGIADGESRPILLTSEKGRILDLGICFRLASDELVLLCGPGRREVVAAWLKRFTIMEDLETSPLDGAWSWLFLESPPVAAPAGTFLASDPDHPDGRSKILLIGPDADRAALADGLQAFRGGNAEAWARFRVEQGHLAFGPGLDGERLNPLEAGFQHLVSFTKGCYVGQEVVARLDTYQKVRRERRILHGSGPSPALGSELTAEGKSAGILLDATTNPTENDWMGISILRIGVGAIQFAEESPAKILSHRAAQTSK